MWLLWWLQHFQPSRWGGKGKGTSPRHMALGWPLRPLRTLSSTLAGSRAFCSVVDKHNGQWHSFATDQHNSFSKPTRVSSKMAVQYQQCCSLQTTIQSPKSSDFGQCSTQKIYMRLTGSSSRPKNSPLQASLSCLDGPHNMTIEPVLKCRQDVIVWISFRVLFSPPSMVRAARHVAFAVSFQQIWPWMSDQHSPSHWYPTFSIGSQWIRTTKNPRISVSSNEVTIKSGLAVEHRLGILRLLTVATPALEDSLPEATWKLTMDTGYTVWHEFWKGY